MLPLQFAIPGGPELLVILLIAILLFGAPLLLVVLLIAKQGSGTDSDRVAELEQRVEELEAELEEER
ncbi:MAG: sec-independent protein translocase protein TatA [Natronomonas sp.]|jgi:sec-independent protein translocase protein TatA|uniref:hypothetical protein n=1 Tax=Natronomonas sp. TaxID=2184060 RepID=UPI00398A3217